MGAGASVCAYWGIQPAYEWYDWAYYYGTGAAASSQQRPLTILDSVAFQPVSVEQQLKALDSYVQPSSLLPKSVMTDIEKGGD